LALITVSGCYVLQCYLVNPQNSSVELSGGSVSNIPVLIFSTTSSINEIPFTTNS
jgi:hypothetical protein